MEGEIVYEGIGDEQYSYERIDGYDEKTQISFFEVYSRAKCPLPIDGEPDERLCKKSDSARKKIMYTEKPREKPYQYEIRCKHQKTSETIAAKLSDMMLRNIRMEKVGRHISNLHT